MYNSLDMGLETHNSGLLAASWGALSLDLCDTQIMASWKLAIQLSEKNRLCSESGCAAGLRARLQGFFWGWGSSGQLANAIRELPANRLRSMPCGSARNWEVTCMSNVVTPGRQAGSRGGQ